MEGGGGSMNWIDYFRKEAKNRYQAAQLFLSMPEDLQEYICNQSTPDQLVGLLFVPNKRQRRFKASLAPKEAKAAAVRAYCGEMAGAKEARQEAKREEIREWIRERRKNWDGEKEKQKRAVKSDDYWGAMDEMDE